MESVTNDGLGVEDHVVDVDALTSERDKNW